MKKETKKPITDLQKYSKTDKYLYMLLSRLYMDSLNFIDGFSKGDENRLWALDKKDHINEMYYIHDYLDQEPEWLTLQDIKEIEKQMNNIN